MSRTATVKAPSAKQMSYLHDLAEQTGNTFAYPKTSAEASREIDRLKRLKSQTAALLPKPEGDDPRAMRATDYRPEEITGYGSSARWSTSLVSEKIELARYTAGGAERVIYRQQVNGYARLTDKPADEKGRSYLIDSELGPDDEDLIVGILRDYLEQAQQLDAIPMATGAARRELNRMSAA